MKTEPHRTIRAAGAVAAAAAGAAAGAVAAAAADGRMI